MKASDYFPEQRDSMLLRSTEHPQTHYNKLSLVMTDKICLLFVLHEERTAQNGFFFKETTSFSRGLMNTSRIYGQKQWKHWKSGLKPVKVLSSFPHRWTCWPLDLIRHVSPLRLCLFAERTAPIWFVDYDSATYCRNTWPWLKELPRVHNLVWTLGKAWRRS